MQQLILKVAQRIARAARRITKFLFSKGFKRILKQIWKGLNLILNGLSFKN